MREQWTDSDPQSWWLRMRVNEMTADRQVPADELAMVPGAILDEK
jgi:hypothetical protein